MGGSGHAKEYSASSALGDKFRVAGWTVDVRALEITNGEQTSKLEPKVMELLVSLATRPGEVLRRDELQDALWHDLIVGYDSLTTAVIKLRRAFGDSARKPRIIETVPKVGYRLIAEVTAGPKEGDETAGESVAGRAAAPVTSPHGDGQTRWRWPTAAAAIVLFAVVVSWSWWENRAPAVAPIRTHELAYPLPDKPSIAVLPFKNMSSDTRQEYFVNGITEDLITDLSKVSGLFVVARNSVFDYKDKAVQVREVAEALGVRYVLEGSVRREGGKVRINAQLIDALTGGYVWAERYDGVITDVFALQDRVTYSIVKQLAVNLGPGESAVPLRAQTANARAYDLYLQGWEQYRQGTAASYARAIPLLEQALDIDPDYPRARAAVAAVYWNSFWRGWWPEEAESLGQAYYETSERVRVLLRSSMERPTALTHQIASERAAYYAYKPDKALAEADKALALDPNDPAGHLAKANALLKAGRPREAEVSIRTAMRLDPHYPPAYLVRLARAQFQLGEYQRTSESLEQAISQTPDDDWALVYLAATYGQLGLKQKAADTLKRANALRAEAGWGPVTVLAAGHPFFRWLGDRDALREGLRKAGASLGGEWLSLIDYSVAPPEIKGVPTINARTAKALYDRGAVFIDVKDSWFAHRIPGSYFLEMWSGEGWLFNEAALHRIADTGEEIVIYCPTPTRSAQAGALAASRGFRKVYYFPGGLNAWVAAGYPVETGPQPAHAPHG